MSGPVVGTPRLQVRLLATLELSALWSVCVSAVEWVSGSEREARVCLGAYCSGKGGPGTSHCPGAVGRRN